MFKKRHVLIVSHIAFRNKPPYDPVEGPYSSVCQAFSALGHEVTALLLPLKGFGEPIFFGLWKKEKLIKIPRYLGRITFLKYITDFFIILFFSARFKRERSSKTPPLIIGIDPLCALPLTLFHEKTQNKVLFYSVDFNEKRFTNPLLQYLYEKSDEVSSRLASQVWVVCESLQQYKKKKYGVSSVYIPNSTLFTPRFLQKGQDKRTGDKLAWTGSCVSERQFSVLFQTIKKVQYFMPNLKLYFAPVGRYDEFRENCKIYKLRNWHVLELKSRSEWQEFSSTCDFGIAVYDDQFGSTKYIEPLKIWDFMLCGLPFLISREPSLNSEVRKSGVVYVLGRHNKIENPKGLRLFIKEAKQSEVWEKCLLLAKKYEIKKQINLALKKL